MAFFQVHAPNMESMVKLDEWDKKKGKEPLKPLVTTEFIAWCSKRVTEPLLDVIEGWFFDSFLLFLPYSI